MATPAFGWLSQPPGRPEARAVAVAVHGRRSLATAARGAVLGKAGAVNFDAGIDAQQLRLLFEDE
jgi:hypothetical protein